MWSVVDIGDRDWTHNSQKLIIRLFRTSTGNRQGPLFPLTGTAHMPHITVTARATQDSAMRACTARADRCFDICLSTDRRPGHHPAARSDAGPAHGRSGTSGAVAAAAQAPQITTAATLPLTRSASDRFRRLSPHARPPCCLTTRLQPSPEGTPPPNAKNVAVTPCAVRTTRRWRAHCRGARRHAHAR